MWPHAALAGTGSWCSDIVYSWQYCAQTGRFEGIRINTALGKFTVKHRITKTQYTLQRILNTHSTPHHTTHYNLSSTHTPHHTTQHTTTCPQQTLQTTAHNTLQPVLNTNSTPHHTTYQKNQNPTPHQNITHKFTNNTNSQYSRFSPKPNSIIDVIFFVILIILFMYIFTCCNIFIL